jgi:hypothetical protein
MLSPIKHVDVSANSLGGYEIGVLRHVTCSVDFVLVVDALDDSHARRGQGVVIAQFWLSCKCKVPCSE